MAINLIDFQINWTKLEPLEEEEVFVMNDTPKRKEEIQLRQELNHDQSLF